MQRINSLLTLALAVLVGIPYAQGARPDPLLAVDQNRATVIERIVSEWGDALALSGAGIDPARLREMLASLRADHLLAASLAGSISGLRDVLANAAAPRADAARVAIQAVAPATLGDTDRDVVYVPVTPCRLVETRGSFPAVYQGGGAFTSGETRNYTVQGGNGVCTTQLPPGVAPSALQIQVFGIPTTAGSGDIEVLPQGSTFGSTATLVYLGNLPFTSASTTTRVNTANNQIGVQVRGGGAHVAMDVVGYFRAPGGGYVTGSCPAGKAVRSVNPDGSVVCESTGASAMYQPALRPWVLDLSSLGPNYCCYVGGFTDGVNAYFVPYALNGGGYQGRVFRVNIDAFTTAASASVDVAAIDANAIGFIGGFTDGRYGYLVPYANFGGKHGRVARIDLQNFTTGGVTILNLQSVDAALSGFYGGFTDGRYGYLISYYNTTGPSGRLVRIDLSNFAPAGVAVLNLASVDAELVGHTGAFTDGRYAYVFGAGYPTANGKVTRVDLSNFTTGGVTVLDLAAINPAWKGFVGGFQDGRYGYLVPYNNGAVHGDFVRIDLGNFAASGVTAIDLATVDPGLVGFFGGFTDGRYAWLAPYVGSKAARIDLANFSASGVRVVDFGSLDASLSGFGGGFTNGRHGVMVPYAHPSGSYKQKAVRIQLWEGAGTQ